MGQIAKALGAGANFEFKGVHYKMAPWTYRILGEFELFLQEKALRNMRKMRSFLTSEEYNELVKETRRDLDVGLYTFGSDKVKQALQSSENLKRLIFLCIQVGHSEISEELVQDMWDTEAEMLLQKMDEANSDPNPRKPETTKENISSSATAEQR